MAKTAMIRARIEPELKEEAEAILNKLGMSVSEAIAIFFKQVRYRKGLPFDVRIPNRTTRKALRDSEANKGITHYKNVDEMFEKLRR
ncbi:MAG: type II toxin-antitoxin system RelB/DinJ family antitoxin [Candidatus Kapaibacterium sp.]